VELHATVVELRKIVCKWAELQVEFIWARNCEQVKPTSVKNPSFTYSNHAIVLEENSFEEL